jgi:hypothetical protein
MASPPSTLALTAALAAGRGGGEDAAVWVHAGAGPEREGYVAAIAAFSRPGRARRGVRAGWSACPRQLRRGSGPRGRRGQAALRARFGRPMAAYAAASGAPLDGTNARVRGSYSARWCARAVGGRL